MQFFIRLARLYGVSLRVRRKNPSNPHHLQGEGWSYRNVMFHGSVKLDMGIEPKNRGESAIPTGSKLVEPIPVL